MGSYASTVLILNFNDTSEEFTLHQTLHEYAPYKIEVFHGKINHDEHKHFLAVAGKEDFFYQYLFLRFQLENTSHVRRVLRTLSNI